VLVITHYSRLLAELKPDRVHILVKGRIVASGGPELAAQLDVDGYAAFAPVEDLVPDDAPDTKPVERPGSLDDLFSM
jgi:Fe-S cluster assembly ATP-binding protein